MINEARELSTIIRQKVNSFFPARSLSSEMQQKHCYLCEQIIYRQHPICKSCEQDLPWNNHSCDICAIPMTPLINHGQIRVAGSHTVNVNAVRVCGECLKDNPSYRRCVSAFNYAFPINALISDFKYNGRRHLGKLMTQMFAENIATQIEEKKLTRPDLIIPVPLHNNRIKARGFNQSEDIGTDLGRHLNVPVDHSRIRRVVDTPPQATLNKKERRRNLLQAFQVLKTFDGEVIALVDDVITTGATVELLSAMLLDAGAKAIDVWSLARTPLDGR